jgi:secretion/DNA translocation related TadE-like protein
VTRRDETGSGTLLVVAAVLVAATAVAVVLGVGSAIAAFRLVRGAADLVAFGAAVAHADGRDACAAAADLAGENGTVLRRCTIHGDLLEFAVTVEVGPAERTGLLPLDVTAAAHAGATVDADADAGTAGP